MNKKVDIACSTLTKFVALLVLTVMVTLVVGRSLHTFIHATHCCEHVGESEHNHDHHDCKICKFELSLFDRVEGVAVTFIVCLISTIFVGNVQNYFIVNLLARTSRAPPYSII